VALGLAAQAVGGVAGRAHGGLGEPVAGGEPDPECLATYTRQRTPRIGLSLT